MFPEGEKTISNGLIFHDRGLEATKRLQIADVSKVHSRFDFNDLSRFNLCSVNRFYPARFKHTCPSARPDPMYYIRVQYCLNFI